MSLLEQFRASSQLGTGNAAVPYSQAITGLTAGTTYYYWLQAVDIYGGTSMHGPVSADFTVPTAQSSMSATSKLPLPK